MSFITIDRHQLGMLPASVNEYIEQDALCRFVVTIVALLDLGNLFSRYSSQGGDTYPPDMLLALWFFAYSHGIVSTRELEERCIYDLRFRYIAGDLHPDHSTLSRFRKTHLDLMKGYFFQIVQLARKQGISDFKSIHIDGTKIQAKSSKRHNRTVDNLERQLSSIRQQIDEYMQRCDEIDVIELPQENLEQVQEKLAQLKRLESHLEERHKQLRERKETLKSDHRPTHRINLQEPDARNMRTTHGILPAYNAQAAVDQDTHFMVANDLVTDTNDYNQFSNIHHQTESNLGENKNRQYTNDAGYHNLEQLQYAEQNGVDLVTNDPTPQNRSLSKTPIHLNDLLEDKRNLRRSDFGYDNQTDCYYCPAGKRLVVIQHVKASSGKGARKIYQAESSCSNCVLFKQCMPKKSKSDRRRMTRDLREKYAEAMAHKLLSNEAQQRLKKRMTTNEPVFGHIKKNLNLHRFSLRGHAQARGEYQLMCIAHNLGVLHRLIGNLGKKSFQSRLRLASIAIRIFSKTNIILLRRYLTKLDQFSNVFLSTFNFTKLELVSATASREGN